MENKKRVYTVSQDGLELIKHHMKELGLKANNTTAVDFAVNVLASTIHRAYEKEAHLKELENENNG